MKFIKRILFIVLFFINFKKNYCQFQNIDERIINIINPLTNDNKNITQRYIGIAVGIIKNDHEKFYSFGSVNINNNEKPKKNTIFEIGSITKTFTASLLMDTYLRKIVKLDDILEICKLNSTNGYCFEDTPISLTNLSTHTSGYPKNPSNLPLTLTTPDNYSRNNLNEFLLNYTLQYKPGTVYEYSNVGFSVLGLYLSDKQNNTYKNLIEERITKKFDLKDTKIKLNTEQEKRYAHGYLSGIETPHWNMNNSSLSPAGGLHSTINDMLKYIKLQISDENKVFKLTHIEKYIINTNTSIGLSWFIDKNNNIIWHDGSTYGFTSFIGFDKKNKVGVIIMANSYLENDTRINEKGIEILNILRNKNEKIIN
jgi:CubicO group peptidase (beta-lactamase class C family)